jgi:drug/metabolite transporter (DMT)-like permease
MHDGPINRIMGAREWGMLLALSVLWGGSFLFVGVAVKELPPLTIVVLRVGLAALALHVLLQVRGMGMPRDPQLWATFFVMGVLNNAIPFTLIAWGQGHIASGVASILNATTPLFTVIVAHYWTADEKITPGRVAGVIVGFAGVAVMIGGAALLSLGVDILAQIAVLTAGLFYAFSGVYGRRFNAMGVEPLVTTAGMLTASSVILLPVTLIVDQPWTLATPSLAAAASVLALALISTALAYLLFFRILASAGTTNLSLVTFIIPINAIVLGTILLGERLEPKHFAGMALIGLGLAAIDGRPFAAARRLLSGSRPALPARSARPRSD